MHRQVAEHDPPPLEELVGDDLGQPLAVVDGLDLVDERPPAGRGRGAAGTPTAAADRPRGRRASPLAVDQRTDGGEPVGGEETAGDAVPEGLLDVGAEPAGVGRQLGQEPGAAGPQRLDDLRRRPHARRLGGPVEAGGLEEPGQILPEGDRDGRGLRRCGAPIARRSGWREPQPGDLAVVAQAVEHAGAVAVDAGSEDVGLPADRGGLVAL